MLVPTGAIKRGLAHDRHFPALFHELYPLQVERMREQVVAMGFCRSSIEPLSQASGTSFRYRRLAREAAAGPPQQAGAEAHERRVLPR